MPHRTPPAHLRVYHGFGQQQEDPRLLALLGLKNIHEEQGFRGKDLVLPADWQVTGFYSLLSEGGKYFIVEKNNGGKVFLK